MLAALTHTNYASFIIGAGILVMGALCFWLSCKD